MDPDFTNREIKAMFQDLKDGNDRIEIQTTKHNGRLTTLERWQAHMIGAVAVLTTIVVPLLAWSLWILANIDNKIHSTIDEALQAYEIKYEDK